MIKKGFVIGIVIVFLVGSFASGITINITDSVEQTEYKNFQYLGNRDSGLVAHWSFDEGSGNTAYDSSGNSNDGTISGATWTSNTPSGEGFALDFDGYYDYMIKNPISNFPTTQITVVFWMNSTDTIQYGTPISYASSAYANDFVIADYRNFSFVIGDEPIYTTGVSANDGIWHHIALTWKSSDGQVKLYKDGNEENTTTLFTGGSITNGGSFVIGGDQDCVGGCWEDFQFFKGIIDEVGIYNRVLSEDEIQYIYENPGVGDTVYVDDDFNESTPGWQIDHFDKIQDGVDAVNVNGTVNVYNGIYFENVVVDKSINLLGEDKNTTIINGGFTGFVVLVSSNGVVFSGFTVQNSEYAWEYSGILLRYVRKNTISDNIFLNNYIGILLAVSAYNKITDNDVLNNSYGILLDRQSGNNSIIENIVISNNEYGIYIGWDSDYNNIYHNNFIYNTQNAYDECNNIWNDSYLSGGNYWDDYPYDDEKHGPNQDLPGHDRIGDVPYDMPCEHATDYYPLMQPYGWLNEAPEGITIDGTQQGKAGQSYTYTSSAKDPEGDPIYYLFDWCDGNFSDWVGPYPSGGTGGASYTWEKVGEYEIKVKAKDTRGLESEWSDPFPITMPRDKATVNWLLRFLERFPTLERLLNLWF